MVDDNDGTSEEKSITEEEEDEGHDGQNGTLREVPEGFLKLQTKEQMPRLEVENEASEDLLKPVLKSAVVLIIVW